ncbi:hypothetical protein ATCV1_z816R [Acanthocystis turfacea chlorella virus 1]|uniref:Uncharacterized protein z816R n=1 Tax=Chlorovirus heliozoae TaxID=322019 RepID=A7KA76_9PHYC|nr:hypothetical protein ATCV1_z816R [Acanthocystis turfacea chlorella virus 1]ABT16950.1 hypothetical protein ATCV1_z816R [Acanthocystis turfacea chlorella virus 1]
MPESKGLAPVPLPGRSRFTDQKPAYDIHGVVWTKMYTFFASVILNTSLCTSFTPIMGIVPILGAEYPADNTCDLRFSHDAMTYAPIRPSGSGAAESPKSMLMPLNDSMTAPFLRAFLTRFSPASVRPMGSTGRQYVIWSLGYFLFNSAIALLRISTPFALSTAPPSMSKSMRFREYRSITREYSATRASTSVMTSASSVPFAPPNDTDTSPPTERI